MKQTQFKPVNFQLLHRQARHMKPGNLNLSVQSIAYLWTLFYFHNNLLKNFKKMPLNILK